MVEFGDLLLTPSGYVITLVAVYAIVPAVLEVLQQGCLGGHLLYSKNQAREAAADCWFYRRKWRSYVFERTSIGFVVDIVQAVLSIASCVVFIFGASLPLDEA